MKKLHILFVVLLLCIGTQQQTFSQGVPCETLPQHTASAINDFANTIDDSVQAVLEQSIRDYEDSTSIAIVVATVATMDGADPVDYSVSLFNCWGIGNKDSKRGILLVIAINDRHMEIRTGYGIEPFLTDAHAKRIINTEMVPEFKKGNYTTGIQKGVEAIFEKLGRMSWEDRDKAFLEEAAAQERERIKTNDTLMQIVFYILGIIILLLLGQYLRRLVVNLRLKKKNRSAIAREKKDIQSAYELMDQSTGVFKEKPTWAKNEALGHVSAMRHSIEEASALLLEAEKSNRGETVRDAEILISEAGLLINKAHESFLTLAGKLQEKIKKITDAVPARLKNAQFDVEANIKKLLSYTEKGYTFERAMTEQTDYRTLLTQLSQKSLNPEFSLQCYTESEAIQTKSDAVMERIESVVAMKEHIDATVSSVSKSAREIVHQKDAFLEIVAQCKKQYPSSVWRESENKVLELSALLDARVVEKTLSTIELLNGFSEQKFHLASEEYSKVVTSIDSLEATYREIKSICTTQESAKGTFESGCKEAESVIGDALQIIKDSDVSSSTKNSAKALNKKLEEITVDTQKTLVDWVAVMVGVNTLIEDARSLIVEAENEIHEAKLQRKVKAERAAAAAVVYQSTFSTYDSSSNDSFGGFGGGDTGGGGAGGSW